MLPLPPSATNRRAPSPRRRAIAAVAWLVAGLVGFAAAPARADERDPAADALAEVLAQPVLGGSRLAAASKYEQDAAEAPSVVHVRTGGEIRAQGYRTLAEVLESLPGVYLRQDRVYSYVGVRGIERPGDYSSRLLLLIDGIRVNEAIYDTGTGGREFPLDVGLIDRVEYIPGPGSALYGSNAVLGVVNIVTRTASQLPGAAATLELGSGRRRRISATWGGDAGPARVLLGVARERSPGHARLYFPEFDDPQTNHGWAVGQDGERDDKLFASLRWSDWSLTTVLSERRKSDPAAAYDVLFDRPAGSLDRYAFVDLSWGHRWGEAHEVFARLGVAAYTFLGTGLYGTPEQTVPNLTDSHARWLSGELRYVWSGWRDHRVLLGADFQDNWHQHLYAADGEPAPQLYTDARLQSSRASLFLNDEWQLARDWRLNLGARVDRQLDRQVKTTPRVAAFWSISPEWTLKFQRGSAFREPNISETSYQDGVQSVNRSLRAESLRSTELAALWRPSSRFDASLSWYRLVLNDSINSIDLPDGQQVYANTGNARTGGVELEASWQVGAGLRLRGSWSGQRARDLATGATLSDAPRSLAKLTATAAGPWEGSTFGLNLLRVGERLTLAGARLPPYVRANASLTWAPPGERWSLAFGVYNLGAARYADPGGPEHRPDALEQDGRSLRVQLGWTF